MGQRTSNVMDTISSATTEASVDSLQVSSAVLNALQELDVDCTEFNRLALENLAKCRRDLLDRGYGVEGVIAACNSIAVTCDISNINLQQQLFFDVGGQQTATSAVTLQADIENRIRAQLNQRHGLRNIGSRTSQHIRNYAAAAARAFTQNVQCIRDSLNGVQRLVLRGGVQASYVNLNQAVELVREFYQNNSAVVDARVALENDIVAQVGSNNNLWRNIGIGIAVGVIVLVIIIALVVVYKKGKSTGSKAAAAENETEPGTFSLQLVKTAPTTKAK